MENPEVEAPPEKTPRRAYRRDEHHVHLSGSHRVLGFRIPQTCPERSHQSRCCTMSEQKCQEKGWTDPRTGYSA
jgi:hypothetical protein